MKVAEGEITRLIIQMPPRHSKSLTVTIRFPGWWLGKNPDKRIALAAHTASLAQTFSRQVRNEFEAFAPEVWNLSIADDSASVERWGIKGRQGGMVAVGVGGPLTGQGADLLLIDDAVKNFEEAQSRTVKDAVWDWYRSVARTRLHPGGAIIVIMTRWAEDDLAGRLISEAESGGERWTILPLPAVAEEGDLLGRAPGEALWPQRFGLDELMAIKTAVGSYVWNALYQQRPTRQEGAVFQRSWFRYFRDEGEFYLLLRLEGEKRVRKADCWIFQTVDPAATARDTSDFFACGTWAVTPDSELLLIDMFHERLETPKHRALMSALYTRFKPLVQGVENATFGLSLIQEMRLMGLPVVPLNADRDKVARSYPMAARYEAGSVYHRQGASWLGAYEDELLTFPRGAHDDMVDVASYAATVLTMDEARRRSRRGVGRATVIG